MGFAPWKGFAYVTAASLKNNTVQAYSLNEGQRTKKVEPDLSFHKSRQNQALVESQKSFRLNCHPVVSQLNF